MGHTITFAQQKGGAGKTTVLAQLSAAWSADGKTVAVIDLDPQRSLTRWVQLRDDPHLDLIESKDYRAGSDIKAAARSHDFVLVDCPGAASNMLESAIRESDMVIAPCQPSVMDVWATETVLATAKKLKTPVRLLLNRMPPRMGALEDVLTTLGDDRDKLLESTLGNRVAFSKSILAGRTASELGRRSAAATEISALKAEIEANLAN